MSLLHPLARIACARARATLFSTSHRAVHSAPQYQTKPLASFVLWTALAISTGGAFATFGPTIHLESEAPLHDAETTIDPATSIEFPTTIRIPSKIHIPEMSLIGVGVRTVSFLGIKVYSVGFYADLENMNLKIPKSMAVDEKISHIVRNTACMVRIVPVRTTSYTHLRDAFMRALQARMALAKQQDTLSEEEAQAAGSPMRKLKTLFPNSPLNKHTPLDILLSEPTPGRPRALIFRDLGAVESDWVATEFVLHYFEGAGPSPPLKTSVVARLEPFEK